MDIIDYQLLTHCDHVEYVYILCVYFHNRHRSCEIAFDECYSYSRCDMNMSRESENENHFPSIRLMYFLYAVALVLFFPSVAHIIKLKSKIHSCWTPPENLLHRFLYMPDCDFIYAVNPLVNPLVNLHFNNFHGKCTQEPQHGLEINLYNSCSLRVHFHQMSKN